MAVELNPFSPQLIQNRDLLNPPNQGKFQFLGSSPMPENQAAGVDGFAVSRKRFRDEALERHSTVSPAFPCVANEGIILPQFQQQYQMETDAIISQHMKKIRSELEERQRKQARLIASAMGDGVAKLLKEKDDQIQGMRKWNLILQDRIRTLYAENQMLREVARSNEATANSLRTNLEQVLLLQIGGEERQVSPAGEAEEEVGSSCSGSAGDGQRCRKCGEQESSVLVLPCRHLCLCNVCGSGSGSQQMNVCPVCHSPTNATLHLNLSS